MQMIAWHLGLGDAIVCASLVEQLADGKPFVVPCYAHNYDSVSSIFSKHKNIKAEVVHSDWEMISKADIHIGAYNPVIPQNEGEDFVEWFYRQAGLTEKPFDFEGAKGDQAKPPKSFKFLHDDHIRGFKIDLPLDLSYIRPIKNGSILRYIDAIKNAEEIHCIDSSFLHLVERVETKGKLFYHKSARPHSTDFNFKKDWTIV